MFIDDRRVHDLSDVFLADFHSEGLGLQSRALAGGAEGLALVAADEYADVQLVLVALEFLEAAEDARKGLVLGIAFPEQFALGGVSSR